MELAMKQNESSFLSCDGTLFVISFSISFYFTTSVASKGGLDTAPKRS